MVDEIAEEENRRKCRKLRSGNAGGVCGIQGEVYRKLGERCLGGWKRGVLKAGEEVY